MSASKGCDLPPRLAHALQHGAVTFVAAPEDFAEQPLRGRLLACLDETERARMSRFRFDADAHLYLTAHALLRTVLGCLLGCDPADLRFDIAERGRPELAAAWASHGLRFNISHTRGLVACAITRGKAVGVDVERIDRQVDIPSLSKSVLSHSELTDLHSYDGDQHRARFFELWTLKEAHIKALGHGLGLPLRDISFRMPGPPPVVAASMHGASDVVIPREPYSYFCARIAASYQFALALEGSAESPMELEVVTPSHFVLAGLL